MPIRLVAFVWRTLVQEELSQDHQAVLQAKQATQFK